MRRLFPVLIFLLFFTVIGVQVCKSETLRVAFRPYAPWQMRLENGEIGGIDIEFLEELAHKLKFTIEYVEYPFERCLLNMENGSVDMMIGLFKDAHRDEYMYFLDPPYKTKSRKAFYVLKGKENSIRKYEDLYGKNIGVLNGARYFERFDLDEALIKYGVVSFDQNVNKLLKGRVDVIVQTELTGDYLIFQYDERDLIAKAEYSFDNLHGAYIAISRKSPLFAKKNAIMRVLGQMVEGKVYDGLYKKYLDTKK